MGKEDEMKFQEEVIDLDIEVVKLISDKNPGVILTSLCRVIAATITMVEDSDKAYEETCTVIKDEMSKMK